MKIGSGKLYAVIAIAAIFLGLIVQQSTRKSRVKVVYNNYPWGVITLTASRINEKDLKKIEVMIPDLWSNSSGKKSISYSEFVAVLSRLRNGRIVTFPTNKQNGETSSEVQLARGLWVILLCSDSDSQSRCKVVSITGDAAVIDLEQR